MKRIFIISLSVAFFYYLISVVIGFKAGTEVQHMFYAHKIDVSSSEKVSIHKGYKINSKISIKHLSGSKNCPVEFWIERFVEYKKYGVLPLFHFKSFSSDYCIFHICTLNNKNMENLFVKVDGLDGDFNFKYKKDHHIVRKIDDSFRLLCVTKGVEKTDSSTVLVSWDN